jgi:hypothetical protein
VHIKVSGVVSSPLAKMQVVNYEAQKLWSNELRKAKAFLPAKLRNASINSSIRIRK